MSADITKYLGLIPNQNQAAANFIASVSALVQPFADITALDNSIPHLFDIDVAVGKQLDVVGQWVGRSRYLTQPLTGVYFSLDIAGLGFDQGVWLGPNDPVSGLVALPDDIYRTYLKAVIAANYWDGTKTGAEAVYAQIFAPANITILVFDNQDMTMVIGILNNANLNPTLTALLQGGYLDLRPCGVLLLGFVSPSVAGTPFFGFDAEDSSISGFDVGSWATPPLYDTSVGVCSILGVSDICDYAVADCSICG